MFNKLRLLPTVTAFLAILVLGQGAVAQLEEGQEWRVHPASSAARRVPSACESIPSLLCVVHGNDTSLISGRCMPSPCPTFSGFPGPISTPPSESAPA
ncbi:hypothetical protein GGX14DRAFT_476933 [Mycena pura]|uniref:Secreted protein n=1 Tax=Mycena pura TaxID=153505 RepID=A0AAD6USX7_9AGAR|nr:hypothetical protein GGX14DRAFT_476933 [Mycena pura]